MEILELECAITEMHSSPEVLNSRYKQVRGNTGELKSRSVEIMQPKNRKKKEWSEMSRTSDKCGQYVRTHT